MFVKIVTTNLQKYIDQDIVKIKNFLNLENNSENMRKATDLHIEIDGRYANYVKNWNFGTYGYIYGQGFVYDLLDFEKLKHNLRIMKSKIEGLKAVGYIAIDEHVSNTDNNSINISPHIQTDISNNTNVNVSIQEVKDTIENMGALSSSESSEILQKIEDLEKIIKSSDNKKNKWEKAKNILRWLCDKGVDVAVTVLPLFLQIK